MVHRPPYPPQSAVAPRPYSAAAVGALACGILGVLFTFPFFGMLTLLPAAAAVTGARGLRVTHTKNLRGRGMALWGFWLGVAFFLINIGLLFLVVIGMKF